MKLRFVLLVGTLIVFGATLAAGATPAAKSAKQLGAKSTAGMVNLPGGAARMGCLLNDKDCNSDERPAHDVRLKGFWMDETPVTQEAFVRVMGKNPSAVDCPKCPVDSVIWEEARSYCAKVGKRLPTEAEWEYAARGGVKKSRYDELDAIAWSRKNSDGKSHPVGEKLPNAYGLYDVLGNVWEWCADWYDEEYYATSPAINPQGPATGEERVIRGGSWRYDAKYLRASFRSGFNPFYRYDDIGFRCVRDL